MKKKKKLLVIFLITIILLLSLAVSTIFTDSIKTKSKSEKETVKEKSIDFKYDKVNEWEEFEINELLNKLTVDLFRDSSYLYEYDFLGANDISDNIKTYLAMANVSNSEIGIDENRGTESDSPNFPNDVIYAGLINKVWNYRTEAEMGKALEILFGKNISYTPSSFDGCHAFAYSSNSQKFYEYWQCRGEEYFRGFSFFSNYKKENNILTFIQTIGYFNSECILECDEIYISFDAALKKDRSKSINRNSSENEMMTFLNNYKFTFKKHDDNDSYYFVSVEKLKK